MIKFYNLFNIDKNLHPKIINNFKKLIKKGDFILGDETVKFEKKFSKFVGAKYGIGCANGTDALILALKSLNLKKNSEVIVPAMTYCSTVFAVIHANLKPVLVDIENNKSTIDLNEIKKKINSNTKVILPVHLYGSAVDINKIRKLTKKFKQKIYIVDDCAQAHGARDDVGKKIGSSSDISCFSLYPGKNLGAYGDAGIITTNSAIFNNRLRKLRNLGSEKKFVHEYVGLNSRLDTIQATILNEKIKQLSKYNNFRKKIANFYSLNIQNKKIVKLSYSKYCVYHQYVILVKDRNNLIKLLNKNKIEFGFHYPNSINQLKVFKKLFKNKKFENAEYLAKNSISLPMDPNLKSKELLKIVKILNNF